MLVEKGASVGTEVVCILLIRRRVSDTTEGLSSIASTRWVLDDRGSSAVSSLTVDMTPDLDSLECFEPLVRAFIGVRSGNLESDR